MRVAIIDCGAGNLHSVRKAFAHVVEAQGGTAEVTTTQEGLKRATHIVLPGVGTYADCMHGLLAHKGLKDALEEEVLAQKKPLFGICVGMQMLLKRGHEFGTTEGLGWFEGEVRKLAPGDASLRIPHMGWNELQVKKQHPIFAGLEDEALQKAEAVTIGESQQDVANSLERVSSAKQVGAAGKQCKNIHTYFVHSFHATGMKPEEVLATVDYGGEVVACIGRDNVVATQFHPEKSQQIGLTMIANFVRM